jgi:hypothetical protein
MIGMAVRDESPGHGSPRIDVEAARFTPQPILVYPKQRHASTGYCHPKKQRGVNPVGRAACHYFSDCFFGRGRLVFAYAALDCVLHWIYLDTELDVAWLDSRSSQLYPDLT